MHVLAVEPTFQSASGPVQYRGTLGAGCKIAYVTLGTYCTCFRACMYDYMVGTHIGYMVHK